MLIFENNTTGIVTGGGTNAPSPGSGETWTVSTTTFPSSLGSGVYYHVADPALPSEKIKVTAISGGGPYTWTTVRGDEGTTPLSHASSFTIQQVVSAADFMYQPGALIAHMSYGPATEVTYNANTTTLAIMDGTNLTVSFLPPPTGNVYIDITADWALATVSLTKATDMFMGLCAHGNTGVVYDLQSWFGNNNSIVAGAHSMHRYHVTGLTFGTTAQMDLCMGSSGTLGSGGFASFYAVALGGSLTTDPSGPITVDVFASY